MTAAHFPSPATVGVWAWVFVGACLLGILAWEVAKATRTARRERALTEEFRQRKRQLIEEAWRRDDD